MVIKADSDTVYLVATKERSHIAGFIYIENHRENKPIISGPIMVIAELSKMVVVSAVEVEVGT